MAAPPPVYRVVPGPSPEERTDGAERVLHPGPKTSEGEEFVATPEAAGLLANALSVGLTAVERAVRDLTEPQAEAYRSGAAILYWFGLSSWLLGGALAYEVVRRRRTLALAGSGPAGGPDFLPEDLP
jgi:hypothetical protein